jgi:hypothetical protein
MIDDNILSSYQNELDWIRRVRAELPEYEEREEAKMNYRITENGAYRYLELLSSAEKIGTEQAALDLVSLCGENEVNLLVLMGPVCTRTFLSLRPVCSGSCTSKAAKLLY